MSALDDPRLVREEYATERGLLGRRAAYDYATGPDAREVAFAAVVESRAPARARGRLRAGRAFGPRERGARCRGPRARHLRTHGRARPRARPRRARRRRPGASVSRRRVRLRDRGVDALPRARRPARARRARARPASRGRLVAVTNHLDHLLELRELVGAPPQTFTFSGENGESLLREHFAHVDVREAGGDVRFPDRRSVVEYVAASPGFLGHDADVPEFDVPFVVRRRPVVFVADK